MVKQIEADVVVIGAGITGTTIARELSRYKVETVVVEKGGDAGSQGQTKAAGGMLYTGLVMLMSFILKSLIAPDAPLYDPDSRKIRWLEQGFDRTPPELIASIITEQGIIEPGEVVNYIEEVPIHHGKHRER